MVHLLADIFERMPEAGDQPAPRFVLSRRSAFALSGLPTGRAATD
jgi:hypothetical protein